MWLKQEFENRACDAVDCHLGLEFTCCLVVGGADFVPEKSRPFLLDGVVLRRAAAGHSTADIAKEAGAASAPADARRNRPQIGQQLTAL